MSFDSRQFSISGKTLWELIEPYNDRERKLREFLEDVQPGLEIEIVPLNDIYGPTKDDPTLEVSTLIANKINLSSTALSFNQESFSAGFDSRNQRDQRVFPDFRGGANTVVIPGVNTGVNPDLKTSAYLYRRIGLMRDIFLPWRCEYPEYLV